MERIFTIGAYGFDGESFFDALQNADVDVFLDLRRRRGMRGRPYSFVNSTRLKQELTTHRITYRHIIELAPDPATRDLQRQEDAFHRVAKRSRASLSEAFITDYTCRTLDPYNWEVLVKELHSFQRPVLFCVERASEACHRCLVAARIASLTDLPVTDLIS